MLLVQNKKNKKEINDKKLNNQLKKFFKYLKHMINIIFNSVETKNIFKDYGLECRFLKISLKNTKIKQK